SAESRGGDEERLPYGQEVRRDTDAAAGRNIEVRLSDQHPYAQAEADQRYDRPVEDARRERRWVPHEEHRTEQQGYRAPLDNQGQRSDQDQLRQRLVAAGRISQPASERDTEHELVVDAQHEFAETNVNRHIAGADACLSLGILEVSHVSSFNPLQKPRRRAALG